LIPSILLTGESKKSNKNTAVSNPSRKTNRSHIKSSISVEKESDAEEKIEVKKGRKSRRKSPKKKKKASIDDEDDEMEAVEAAIVTDQGKERVQATDKGKKKETTKRKARDSDDAKSDEDTRRRPKKTLAVPGPSGTRTSARLASHSSNSSKPLII
jgi:hypothetical protein